jgi:GST-like protein
MIDLYSWPAPNGHKVQILVEELGIPYRMIPIDITRGAQHEPSYRAINPNGRIPAIVDHAPLDGGDRGNHAVPGRRGEQVPAAAVA